MSIVREYGKDTFLYKTGSGWCGVAIDDFRGNASYLTDVPFDFLYAFKQWIDNKTIPVIFCDEEGSEFRIIVEEFNTYIIHEREEAELKVVDITRKSFVETILKDITENLDWFVVDFSDCDNGDEVELLQRKIDILTNIKYIKEHIEEF